MYVTNTIICTITIIKYLSNIYLYVLAFTYCNKYRLECIKKALYTLYN